MKYCSDIGHPTDSCWAIKIFHHNAMKGFCDRNLHPAGKQAKGHKALDDTAWTPKVKPNSFG